VVDRLLADLGTDRPLANVDGDELADRPAAAAAGTAVAGALERNRAAVAGWLAWCTRNRLPALALPAR
jgi:hypothetical protein